ncbi:5-histidylcysteine sulfoxide synthase [Microbacter margulisiae]|uniref:5-histidylcysteine sulfoxide synthase/putative 4-mercaptohistidine N1-methyltransferase n=1 Tax=Microbacter margulisiae TaxID=1350067 RepID=A0A7W5DR23_9PORP|nr:5-histidylcysteine sulfoxide synthase [Microbacter margulisiae]MBB3187170.1 5-histidylcysteine sulfoxide synthase/putative 4-mercaptohistidine N1-methyltransferase [Microbacter margulisiae]
MKELITKTIDLQHGDPEVKRREILDYFEKTWAIDEKLYTQLKSDEVFYHRGDPLRHVLLFYLGHTAVFYINKLILAKIIDQRINRDFESMFAIGVDEMSWDDLNEKHYNWPPVEEVRAYREKAKEVVLEVIRSMPVALPTNWENPLWIILMGIEHERIHLETSSVLIRQLPLDEVASGLFGKICQEWGEAPHNSMLPVAGAVMTLGKPADHPLFGWDNEYGKYTEAVPDFKASAMLVSNGEFLAFVQDNGYHIQEYWTEEGWSWRNYKQAEMPLFWRRDGESYWLRLVAEEISMPWNWPVEVNYLEAKAFCNWKSLKTGKTYRLPTEAEWVRLAEVCQVPDEPEWEVAPGNINLEHGASPCPVDRFRMGDFYDVIGNVWQWTETPITGYPGFKVHPVYDDFSTPTFDGKHNLIKGGSWISTGNEATHHARYAFRRHFYQHAGFRYVESETPLVIHNDEYETDVEVALSCEANWSDTIDSLSNFYQKLGSSILDVLRGRSIQKVLDLNADTGRLAFELATAFPDVTALDFSARFIRIPDQLKEKGFMRYIMKDEGELVFYREIVLPETLAKGKDHILFMQADAHNLKSLYSGYDLIVMPNLLEELRYPTAFLQHIHERLNDKGWLVIASTYAWNGQMASREFWPGGFKLDGEPLTSFEGIQTILEPHFMLHGKPFDLPLNIRKSSRVTEIKRCEISFWQKKSVKL